MTMASQYNIIVLWLFLSLILVNMCTSSSSDIDSSDNGSSDSSESSEIDDNLCKSGVDFFGCEFLKDEFCIIDSDTTLTTPSICSADISRGTVCGISGSPCCPIKQTDGSLEGECDPADNDDGILQCFEPGDHVNVCVGDSCGFEDEPCCPNGTLCLIDGLECTRVALDYNVGVILCLFENETQKFVYSYLCLFVFLYPYQHIHILYTYSVHLKFRMKQMMKFLIMFIM